MSQYSCKSCKVVFAERPRQDECPVCDHKGMVREYMNGKKSRSDWWEIRQSATAGESGQ